MKWPLSCESVTYRRKDGTLVTRKGVGDTFDKYWTPEPNSGCWLWFGACHAGGYGQYRRQGRAWMAHRISYERAKGEIPAGMDLDHLCRNPSCINPDHLEPVTRRENVMRGVKFGTYGKRMRRVTHCIRGHEFTEQNTYRTREGYRTCRECHNMHARNATKKKREAHNAV